MIAVCPNCGAKNRLDPARSAATQPVCGKCKTPLPADVASGPLEVTDNTIASVLAAAGDTPVLVDCWAPWCGPCRMIAPVIEQLAAESNGRWIVAKLNTDENPQTSAQFNISAIPTMLIFRGGQKVDEIVGLQPKPAIIQRLSMHAAGSRART